MRKCLCLGNAESRQQKNEMAHVPCDRSEKKLDGDSLGGIAEEMELLHIDVEAADDKPGREEALCSVSWSMTACNTEQTVCMCCTVISEGMAAYEVPLEFKIVLYSVLNYGLHYKYDKKRLKS